MDRNYLGFSNFIEQYIERVQDNQLQLNQVAQIRADDIVTGFYRSLEKSYHKQKFTETFLKSICTLRDQYEAKGFEMAVNGLDTSYRSVLFIEIMRELNLIGINDENLNLSISTVIAANGHSNAESIARGFAICVALHDIKEIAGDLEFKVTEPEIIIPESKPAVEQKDQDDETASKNKSTHKQQILILDALGFFELSSIKDMTTQNKGKLISYILNRDEKNSTEYIRNKDIPKKRVSKDSYYIKTENNVKHVNEIIETVKANIVVTTQPTTPS